MNIGVYITTVRELRRIATPDCFHLSIRDQELFLALIGRRPFYLYINEKSYLDCQFDAFNLEVLRIEEFNNELRKIIKR